ncbi:uncharacterized protein LOC123679198 isoform X2 [Harmonia axyridis]|uniref:uncharacterized protein LOC123679198 isoform X2 n=1 Tax=Harmonia axyridis TaxID=115357 RepID=UPI001E27844A|nr:uncharacterized protein LOC123679198 isoform X2 [Harmonia axyridis]
MPLPMALLLSDWSERSYRQARPDINFMRNDLHKKFDEEIAMHKVLYASRRAFLDQIPQYVDTRREVRAPGIEAAPEIHAARRSMLDRASSSKLSVHAPPFTLKTRCSTKERTTQEVGDAFYKFVSSLDEPTLRSLAPTPSCSTTPVPAEEDEQEGAVGYDTSREQDNKKDDPTQTQLTSVEEPNEVPQLDGQRLSEEEEEQQAENALAAHGPVGGQAVVEPAAAAAAVPPPPEDDPATYVIEARTTIIYQDRNILNLDDNVLGQWRDRNRWGRGPDPARAFSYRNAFYAYDPNNEILLPPMFGCYYCETNTEPELPKPPQQPEVPKP